MELLFRYGFFALFLSIPVLLAARRRYWRSATVCFFFAAISFLAMEVRVLAFYLAAIPLLLILKNNAARPKITTVVMTVWAVAALVGSVVTDMREYRALHAKFPLVSLADRLSYEAPRGSVESVGPMAAEVETREMMDRSLDDSSEARSARRRQVALKELHSQTFLEFAAANGFGASRMRDSQYWTLMVDPLPPPKPLPKRPEIIDPPTAIQNSVLAAGNDVPLQPPPLPSQIEAVRQFTAMIDSAYVPARQRAAGFVSHAMTKAPAIQGASAEDWLISRLDLVSLRKFAAPRVYLSEHLPRMDELRNAKTRPVDDFEQRALHQLHEGEDIVLDQQLNTIRMVGAVRAAKQCLDCHSVRRGELLGAFSYLLDRKQPMAPPKVEDKPVTMIRRLFHAS